MLFVNKVYKNCRCLHWSAIWAIFYLFFIGFIIHNITYKLKNAFISNQNESKTLKTQVPEIMTRNSIFEFAETLNKPKVDQKTEKLKEQISQNEKQQLKKAFEAADKNQDNKLSLAELTKYINDNVLAHIEEAISINPHEFRDIDTSPADGLISWEEYHVLFLKEHNITAADIDEDGRSKNRKARDDMHRDKRRWGESARTDLFSLTIDEYLGFRHPESSVSRLLELVDDVLRQFDIDADDMLTLEEFCNVNLNDDVEMMQKTHLPENMKERRIDFKQLIDLNHDGKADRGELLHYIDPKTPRYALREAAMIINLCDTNHDKSLNFKEIEENSEIILNSKMINTAKSFHMEY